MTSDGSEVAERLRKQLSDTLINGGTVSAVLIVEENRLDNPSPAWGKIIPKGPTWFSTTGAGTCFIVGETRSRDIFAGCCHRLNAYANETYEQWPEPLKQWNFYYGGSVDETDWLSLVFWLANESRTDFVKPVNKKCWHEDGHTFDVEGLDIASQMLPEGLRDKVPKNAENWFLKIDDILQSSIDALDYFHQMKTGKVTNHRSIDVASKQPKQATSYETDGTLPVIVGDAQRDYLLFSKIKSEHIPSELFVKDKQLKSFLDQATDIRQGRPPGKNGTANKQKLLIHVGDFVQALPELRQWLNALNASDSEPDDREYRQEQIRKGKEKAGSRNATSRQLPN